MQQASLWPWVAGMVDILAVGDEVGADRAKEQLSWYFRERRLSGGVDETSCRMLDKRRAGALVGPCRDKMTLAERAG